MTIDNVFSQIIDWCKIKGSLCHKLATVHESVSLVLPTTFFQPIIDPHDDTRGKQDSTVSLISCRRYVENKNYFQIS